MTQKTDVSCDELRSIVPALRSLGDDALTELIDEAELREYGDGEELFHEGKEAHALYFVISGEVRVYRVLPQGPLVDLANLGAGSILGEVALLAGSRRTATAAARGRVRALRVQGERLYADYRAGKPYSLVLLMAVARLLAERLEAMNSRVVTLLNDKTRGTDLDVFKQKILQDWTI
jgi:CRP/FNR family transcriptional regulator, cyclic AMP receptor protein